MKLRVRRATDYMNLLQQGPVVEGLNETKDSKDNRARNEKDLMENLEADGASCQKKGHNAVHPGCIGLKQT